MQLFVNGYYCFSGVVPDCFLISDGIKNGNAF